MKSVINGNEKKVVSKHNSERYSPDINKRELDDAKMNKCFAERTKDLLKEKGLLQKDMCEYLNRSENDISKYLKNKKGLNSIPLREASLFAERLGCSTDYLIGKSDVRNYEYHSVAEKTGLSENALKILINENQNRKSGFDVSGDFVNNVNMLLENQDGIDFLTSLMEYVQHKTICEESFNKRIKKNKLEKYVGQCSSLIDSQLLNSNSVSLEDFSAIVRTTLSDKDLSGEDIENLYTHCMCLRYHGNDEVNAFKCQKKLSDYLESI